MKYALTVALMLSLSFGLITESFRYQSTAFLWEDDYDLLFDPARIPEIDGVRLWTGLSNFVTGDEEIFADSGVPFFYIGGSGYRGDYYGGLVYDRSVIKDALPTGLYDPNENPIYGDANVMMTEWDFDPTTGDTLNRNVTTQTASAYDKVNTGDAYIAIAKEMEDLRIGLGYMRLNSKRTMTSPFENFTYEYFEEDYDADTLGYWEYEVFEGDRIFTNNENDIIFSAWMDRDNYALGLQAVYGWLSMGEDGVINGSYEEYEHPEYQATDFYLATSIDSIMTKMSGTNMGIDLKLFYDYNDDAQGRYFVGYFTHSEDYGDDAMEWMFDASHENDEFYNADYYDTTASAIYYEGGRSWSGFRIGTHQLYNINDVFNFGIGIMFTLGSVSSDTLIETDSSMDVSATYEADTLTYKVTSMSSEAWFTTIDGSYKMIEIPVGAEFMISNKLALRLGAVHTLNYNDVTTTRGLYDYQFPTTYIEDPGGTDTTIVDYSDIDEDMWEETDNSTSANTDYYYGIGWHVNDNLTIDLMNFNSLDNLSNWRLSATLRLD
ncbi:hypothetical protein AMJ87_04405 [candidate division WOR_3 bacterium SM23_60]|uniref:Uncharacterized protein n=1 Tax=candidate division WOR_3 bacterium SM23_60 TaxID=1703780 RepID=A0A0S8GHP2_UNCW3|nr:MAG: hypothetical protein AMJ87_04405 [candidate division WOR_3 bacterium SM23_60]